MALKLQFLSPNTIIQSRKFLSLPFPIKTQLTKKPKNRIQCIKSNDNNNNKISDADLLSDLASEVEKINSQIVQREEAMKKSKELLFSELCNYLDMEKDEVKKKWSKMNQDDKFLLVKEFVDEWSANFHPLSAKSVREMIDECLNDEKKSLNPSELFPGLKKMMGFDENL